MKTTPQLLQDDTAPQSPLDLSPAARRLERPPLVDFYLDEDHERLCPFTHPRVCDVNCMAWRDVTGCNDEGYGYCARLSGEWGNDMASWGTGHD